MLDKVTLIYHSCRDTDSHRVIEVGLCSSDDSTSVEGVRVWLKRERAVCSCAAFFVCCADRPCLIVERSPLKQEVNWGIVGWPKYHEDAEGASRKVSLGTGTDVRGLRCTCSHKPRVSQGDSLEAACLPRLPLAVLAVRYLI